MRFVHKDPSLSLAMRHRPMMSFRSITRPDVATRARNSRSRRSVELRRSSALTRPMATFTLVTSAHQQPRKTPVMAFSDHFAVTELHSREGMALWVAYGGGRSTGPHTCPGLLIPRSMTGGGPVDTAVTSACPLLNSFIPRAPVCNGHIFCPLQKNGRYSAVTWGILIKTCVDES